MKYSVELTPNFKVTQTTVLLFAIYSKGETDNLTDKEIQDLIKEYLVE